MPRWLGAGLTLLPNENKLLFANVREEVTLVHG
jgi:hypothetical protein